MIYVKSHCLLSFAPVLPMIIPCHPGVQYSAVVRVDSQGLTTTSLDLTELRDGNSRCTAYEDNDVCDFNILKCQKVVEVRYSPG
jgi:hypothetical protein